MALVSNMMSPYYSGKQIDAVPGAERFEDVGLEIAADHHLGDGHALVEPTTAFGRGGDHHGADLRENSDDVELADTGEAGAGAHEASQAVAAALRPSAAERLKNSRRLMRPATTS